MNFGGGSAIPYLFKRGGNISGDYKYTGSTKIKMENSADIEMATDESRLQQSTDQQNYLCFKANQTYINKDLFVNGNIHTNGDLNVTGHITANAVTDLAARVTNIEKYLGLPTS